MDFVCTDCEWDRHCGSCGCCASAPTVDLAVVARGVTAALAILALGTLLGWLLLEAIS